MYSKICPFCGKEFHTDNARKIYCSQACKARAYENRNGKTPPAFISESEYEITTKEVIKKIPNPEIIKINKEMNDLRNKRDKILLHNDVLMDNAKKLGYDGKQLVGIIGGLGIGAAISHKIENQDARILITLAGAVLGGTMIKESVLERQEKDRRIKEICSNIKINNEEVGKINSLLVEKGSYLSNLPKEIDFTEIVEIKIPMRKQLSENPKPLKGVVSRSELLEIEFDLHLLDGPIGEFLGKIAKNAYTTAFGKPGSGKSTFYVQLAAYLTKFGMVLYATPEEGISPTFQNKLRTISSSLDNVRITGYNTLIQIDKALNTYDYKFCIIDSINMIIDSTPKEFDKLRKKYTDVAFFIIMQCNKDGSYKGSSEYTHGSDINIIVEKGIATTTKTRYGDLKDYQIFEKKIAEVNNDSK